MGTLHSLEHPVQAGVWHGSIPLEHRYTAGVAGERFLHGLKEGKIYGTRCAHCDYTYVPARMYCERCLAHLGEQAWLEIGLEGELRSFTEVHLDPSGQRLAKPRWVGLVRLGGASGVLMHNLEGVTPENARVGLAVKAVFRPAKERSGSINDIRHFAPA
ncbi:MAG: hypothetical protein A2Z30_05060 [Chloroflexi bacterium RBG_16_64_43]|nr:MAG: hypothetical protein A2Z30_05060 [Chloroflexi bacterium RBG_16_64_43]